MAIPYRIARFTSASTFVIAMDLTAEFYSPPIFPAIRYAYYLSLVLNICDSIITFPLFFFLDLQLKSEGFWSMYKGFWPTWGRLVRCSGTCAMYYLIECWCLHRSKDYTRTSLIVVQFVFVYTALTYSQAPWSVTFWLVYEQLRIACGVGTF